MKTASRYYKKGQIQMMETIMVLIVVFILIIIGVFFYYKFKIQSIDEEIKDLELERYTFLLSSIPSMPELKCTERGQEELCVDSFKLMAFKNTLSRDPYYKSLFKKSEITIEFTYPETNSTIECTPEAFSLNTFPENCKYFLLYQSTEQKTTTNLISTPISIYFPHIDQYKLGKLVIAVYQDEE